MEKNYWTRKYKRNGYYCLGFRGLGLLSLLQEWLRALQGLRFSGFRVLRVWGLGSLSLLLGGGSGFSCLHLGHPIFVKPGGRLGKRFCCSA